MTDVIMIIINSCKPTHGKSEKPKKLKDGVKEKLFTHIKLKQKKKKTTVNEKFV